MTIPAFLVIQKRLTDLNRLLNSRRFFTLSQIIFDSVS